MSIFRRLIHAKPEASQLFNLLLLSGLCMFTCQAMAQDRKRPDVGAALDFLAYYYEPLLAASVPKRHPDLARVFEAIDAAHHGRRSHAINELDKIANETFFASRGQVLAVFFKARLEADRDLRLDDLISGRSSPGDDLMDESRRPPASGAAHAAFVAANIRKKAFLPDAISKIVAFDGVLDRCLIRNPRNLQAKTREALVRHLRDGADIPNQNHMLNVEATPLIDRCLSDFDRLAGSVAPKSALTTSTRAALRLEIIAGEVLAATLHGRLDLSQDALAELVMVFQEAVQPVQAAGDFCAEAWLWLRFATLEMRPSGSITTLGLDLRFEELIYNWLLDRINAGPNAFYVSFTAPPLIDSEASSFVSVFGYSDAGKIGQLLDLSEHKAKACSDRTGLDLAVAWTRALLELPWFSSVPYARLTLDHAAAISTLDHAAAVFRDFAERARNADDRHMERLALQVSDILAGRTSGFSERLAGALSDEDMGLAMIFVDTTAALAIRQLVFMGEYTSAVRALEQLQWSLYRERLFLSSARALKRLTDIYSLYPQRLARAAAMTEYVHRLGEYIKCDPDVRFRSNRGCGGPSYERALRIEWGVAAAMRLGFMAQLAMEWSSNSWMRKVNADRAALSPGMISNDISRDIDHALVGMSQYVETTIKIQRQISCPQRLRLSSRLASEFEWSNSWSASGRNATEMDGDPLGNISSFVAANRAHFVHCDPAAEQELLENLEGFDPVAVLEAGKGDNKRAASAVGEILDKCYLAISAGFVDLASEWFRRLKRHGVFEDKVLAARFFSVQVAVARSAEEMDAAMSDFLPLVSLGLRHHDPEQSHDINEAAIQLMTQAGLADKALLWLEDATAARSYNFRVSLDLEPRQAEAFERASLERRLVFDGSLPEADWSRLHELRLARVAPDGSSSERLPPEAIQTLPKRLPAGTAAVRFHFFETLAVAFVVEANRPVRVVELSRNLNPLMLRLEKFVASLVWGVDVSEDARWAYNSFVKPLNLSPSLSRLIIVPGDFLSSVPFEMLPEASGRPLGERVEVAYTNRLWRSHAAPMPHIRSDFPAVLVGIDNAGLVHAEEEVRDIAQLFETSVVVNTPEASQDTVQRHLGAADVLHFATHGHISSIDPFSSALELAEGQEAPFWWLAKQHFKPKLLVLSACQTAESGPIYSRRVTPGYFALDDSLASIAEFVDTPYVIATLWPVIDETSKALMVRFYQNLFGDADGDPITAMHKAKMAHAGTGPASGIEAFTEASFRVFVPSVEDILR